MTGGFEEDVTELRAEQRCDQHDDKQVEGLASIVASDRLGIAQAE